MLFTLNEQIKRLSTPIDPIPTDLEPEIASLSGIRAVIFDVYGTLFISGSGDISIAGSLSNETLLAESMAEAGFRGNLVSASLEGISLFFELVNNDHAQGHAAGRPQPEIEVREIWDATIKTLEENGRINATSDKEMRSGMIERMAVGYECRVNPVWPMPGTAKIIEAIYDNKLSLGIVSNAQFYTPLLFESLLGNSCEQFGFNPECCIWSYRERRSKPDVTLFEKLLNNLKKSAPDITPEQVLYVGNDCLNDVWCASQAGLKTCLFAGDKRSLRLRTDDARCAQLKADCTITHLEQLATVLGINP